MSTLAQLTFEGIEQTPLVITNGTTPERNQARRALHCRFASKLKVNNDLTRMLVSFQANKNTAFYRWFKYREGFSSELVQYLLNHFKPQHSREPRVLDPFAGAGTTLTTSAKSGWKATGIELLLVGRLAIRARLLADSVDADAFRREMHRLKNCDFGTPSAFRFPHIRITAQAFSDATETAISAFVGFIETIEVEDVRELFRFACLSILEDVSFTRKDGQYLRWDSRAGRKLKGSFNKGQVYEFQLAINKQLELMLDDIKQRERSNFAERVQLIEGSCLEKLPQLKADTFDLVITSPPYCNRYDYTRTYALELAFLEHGEEDVKRLRQTLLSATVENKSKRAWLSQQYSERGQSDRFDAAASAFDNNAALHEVLDLLHIAREANELNNSNIPNLVENYFLEMSVVVHELSRALAPGGYVVMVNDNVQYMGEEVPVDLILSDFAEKAGLSVKHIWVLPKGKGNSSQQMGTHGRTEIRKCVYVWSKPTV